MARPWFEAAPALAASPAALIPIGRPAHPFARTLRMAGSPRFAFVAGAEPGARQPRPAIHAGLTQLADAIERRRDGRALQLREVEDFELEDRAGLYTAVQIFTLDMSNDPDGLLGTAWLDGAGREVLEPALRQALIRADRQAVAA